jgi:hypothetical protein
MKSPLWGIPFRTQTNNKIVLLCSILKLFLGLAPEINRLTRRDPPKYLQSLADDFNSREVQKCSSLARQQLILYVPLKFVVVECLPPQRLSVQTCIFCFAMEHVFISDIWKLVFEQCDASNLSRYAFTAQLLCKCRFFLVFRDAVHKSHPRALLMTQITF